ncbi:MAG: hypothetical protein IJ766_09135 [Clostridia bacterium]|nr:hypothetical protein [Clostridia bacterium]
MTTTQKLTDDICLTLAEHFPDCEIYTEKIEQGHTKPCFLVTPEDTSITHTVGRRFMERYQMRIRYLYGGDAPKAECAAVKALLYRLLRDVRLDGAVVHGADMHIEDADSVI